MARFDLQSRFKGLPLGGSTNTYFFLAHWPPHLHSIYKQIEGGKDLTRLAEGCVVSPAENQLLGTELADLYSHLA